MHFTEDTEKERRAKAFRLFMRTELNVADIDACDKSIVDEGKELFQELADLTFFIPLLPRLEQDVPEVAYALRSQLFIAVLRYVRLLNRVDTWHGRRGVMGPLRGQFAVAAFRALVAELVDAAAAGADHISVLEELLRRLHRESWRRSLGAA